MSEKKPTLSVIITAHSESILIHRTLKSVRRSINELSSPQNTEIILHVDNPTLSTLNYIDANKNDALEGVRIYTNHFGDLGESRNFSVKKALGAYVATIDADDIMSKNWLVRALELLESQASPTVAHSEFTVEFEGADSLVVKHGQIDFDTDTLLSVFANRWNSVIVAPRSLLVENPYTPNSPGYGYEDWNLNCRLIHQHVQHLLVPETAIFVRRKKSNSEWARQIQSMAVLRANPLLSFDTIRSISDPFKKAPKIVEARASTTLLQRTKSVVKKNRYTHKVARYIKRSLKRQDITPRIKGSHVPSWLQDEWLELHAIDRQIFPHVELMNSIPVYDTITEDHKLAGSLYKALVDQLRFDHYEYVIFTPWLTQGGADKYAIEYANTISSQLGAPVLVVTTLPAPSPWADRLNKTVDHLDFGNLVTQASPEIRQRLMEHIIENAGTRILHVINSEFGYDFIQLHENYLKSSGKKVVITSFSQSLNPDSGYTYGYSHTHVPFVYDIADLITSDNQAVIDMWVRDYGFDAKKLIVHRQPLDLTATPQVKDDFSPKKRPQILWAARIAPEKLPEVAVAAGKELTDSIDIDMYGTMEPGFEALLKSLPENVSYKGAYSGFDSLDIKKYDALLYTSLFDGMPNVLLEAAAAKLPIVASGVGGIPEFIENEKNGIVIHDIHNPLEYVHAIHQIFEDNSGETYALNSYKKLQDLYSREQYSRAVMAMLKRLGSN